MATSLPNTLTPFQTEPARYRHWHFATDGELARLSLDVQEEEGSQGDYALKQNSYDLSVDIELHDALLRLRFEHPQVKVLVIDSAVDRIFCAGANIYMLGRSAHAFKQNFCRYTNETRILLEETSRETGLKSIAALNGTAAGGGYELAMACDKIYLQDDGNSAVSLPEVALLGVLPGTGGLTRLVDKRQVRRDLADVFCTVAEGVKGPRAKAWGLVDELFPKSRFQEEVLREARELAACSPRKSWPGISLAPVEPAVGEDELSFQHVTVQLDRRQRVARLIMQAPSKDEPTEPEGMLQRGAQAWALCAFRELDRALLHLRVDFPEIGLVLLETRGSQETLLRMDDALDRHRSHPFVAEMLWAMGRTLRRLDLSTKSFFALIEPSSCFAGCLMELALAADRSYMLMDDGEQNAVALSALNGGDFPMTHGLTRLQNRFQGDPQKAAPLLERAGELLSSKAAEEAGLVTFALDDLDFEDETRLAMEERASLSPDALTGMEASLRFPGPESLESKIFGRLSAWQNWIFQRPNAVGPKGALTNYGQPTRPVFDFRRT